METEIEHVKGYTIIRTLDDVERAAIAMLKSGFFSDIKQANQAIVKILAGQELGFGTFASMTGVNIIQNKPALSANLLAAAIKRTGKYNYRIVKHTEEECVIDFFEGKEKVGTSSFTIEDARKAGVANKDVWTKYARNMLFARALSNGQKWYAPDIFGGVTVYTGEELDAEVDAEGNLIPKIDAGEDVLEIIPTVAPKTEHEIVEQLAPSAQPTENVTKDGTRNVESMNGSTIKHLVSLHLFENDFSAAKVVARFALKKGPLNKFVELATDYRNWKEYLVKSGVEAEAATATAIDNVNHGKKVPQLPTLEGEK